MQQIDQVMDASILHIFTCRHVHVAQGPIAQTVKQVQAAFDALLDIAALQHKLASRNQESRAAADVDGILERTAKDLLTMGRLPS